MEENRFDSKRAQTPPAAGNFHHCSSAVAADLQRCGLELPVQLAFSVGRGDLSSGTLHGNHHSVGYDGLGVDADVASDFGQAGFVLPESDFARKYNFCGDPNPDLPPAGKRSRTASRGVAATTLLRRNFISRYVVPFAVLN